MSIIKRYIMKTNYFKILIPIWIISSISGGVLKIMHANSFLTNLLLSIGLISMFLGIGYFLFYYRKINIK